MKVTISPNPALFYSRTHPSQIGRRARIAALDVGSSRIGMAMTDDLQQCSRPWGTFCVSVPNQLTALQRLLKNPMIVGFIIGWPYDLKGREGLQTDRTLECLEKKKIIPNENSNVLFWDERYTTKQAKESLNFPQYDKDAMAALEILQEYQGWMLQR